MGLGAKFVHEVDDIVDIGIEVELAVLQRHVARIDPVGDVDIMMRQQCLYRSTQQGGMVPGHRGHDQQLWIIALGIALEAEQPAERLFHNCLFLNRDLATIDLGTVQTEFRLGKTSGGALEHFSAGSNRTAKPRIGQRE